MKLVLVLLTACFYLATSNLRRGNNTDKVSHDPAVRNMTPPQKGHIVKLKNQIRVGNKDRNVTVIDTTMNTKDQHKVMKAIRTAYDSSDNPQERSRLFQEQLAHLFKAYPHVVINTEVVVYYENFYIYLEIDDDLIFAFGL